MENSIRNGFKFHLFNYHLSQKPLVLVSNDGHLLRKVLIRKEEYIRKYVLIYFILLFFSDYYEDYLSVN